LQNNPKSKVVVCGGQGKDESASEASVMVQYLIEKGIDTNQMYPIDKSTRTAQQFIYVNSVLLLGKTVVVTSDVDILRLLMLAKRSGINVVLGLAAPLDFSNGDKYIALKRNFTGVNYENI
jgi:uncharacterized SAM-binding protein YcdF (DUF218 family)